LPNFHVVDTRQTLVPAVLDDAGNCNDWLNEIHPNYRGYRKLAAKLSAGIAGLLDA
jgi:lysophospholipase L1-like esterase